jgi:hypothetical protein
LDNVNFLGKKRTEDFQRLARNSGIPEKFPESGKNFMDPSDRASSKDPERALEMHAFEA